jgi:hypothetical protein
MAQQIQGAPFQILQDEIGQRLLDAMQMRRLFGGDDAVEAEVMARLWPGLVSLDKPS